MKKRVHLLAAPSASGGRSRRKTLPVLLLAGVTVFVVVLVFSEGQIQAGYLRYIATPRQYVSHRTTRVPVPRVFTRSASCPQTPTPPSMYHFSKDPRPPPALVSYPGSGSTLTRLLLEMATQVYSGSVYGDFRYVGLSPLSTVGIPTYMCSLALPPAESNKKFLIIVISFF